ncbi:MAG TPA: galactitol-1-phosphate 5-dehydrogenase, partial [Clostridiales bacterium]|nr:galactitol-1-phosphate 5-dehydrogenase [Clostridiales bacterium]
MKALVLTEYNCLSIQEMPVPDIGREEVLVRVKACAICGSDVHGMDGSTGRRIPPVVMGHEASGVIEAVGCAVSQYRAGDRVTFDSTVYCQKCNFCKRGEVNLCDNRRVIGVSCAEYRRNGAFAEYVAVPQHILYRLPDGLSFERAAMVEPLSIALHAVSRAPALLNANAVVVGAGMIGLLIIQLLRLAGCRQIIAVDLKQEKLDLAVKFGATAVWKAGAADANAAAATAAIGELTDGTGADVAFEVVGLNSTVQMAVAVLRKGGSLTLVGNLSPVAEIPLQAIVTREISLRGSCASAGEYAGSLDLIAAGKIDVDSFISAVAPLSEGAA